MTKNLPGDTEIIFEAQGNPVGQCWEVFHLECTTIGHFGVSYPALKLLDGKDELPEGIFVGECGNWADGLIKSNGVSEVEIETRYMKGIWEN